jgi:hypothetical protein
VLLAALVASTGCATTGATFNSGVGDVMLANPPYYAGSPTAAAPTARTGLLPLLVQRGAAQPAAFDPRTAPGTPMATLVAEMRAYLDSLASASGLVPVRLAVMGADAVPPDVRFGCLTEGDLPGEDCAARGDSALGRGDQRMKLAVGRPSPAWIAAATQAMDSAGVARVLVLSLETAQYLPKQKGLAGRKSVELGTAHEVELPWLTSLETPVAVLQVTGALVERDGRAARIGAEGIVARRTRLAVSALGAQEVLTDDDINAVRTRRRDDLPGAPLAWREALRTLVSALGR